MQETSSSVVNHARVMVEEMENSVSGNSQLDLSCSIYLVLLFLTIC